ncbi:uncharacterized protein LOC109838320 [Asparagus officinalis]|uniref:uncharacterized protein LOC109838320 n=1 Tax=Asparagus officinalis TaxID=4686 RepID=UPI00098E2520|nr:uncharacterized protein LOC109838320 [Asparagus officinalis]
MKDLPDGREVYIPEWLPRIRSLYQQAPRAWIAKIDAYFQKNEFQQSPYEHSLYTKKKDGDIMIICLYMDDMIFTSNNPKMFEEFKKNMIKEFKMTDIGKMSYFLGVKVSQSKRGIFISQKKYAKEILWKFNMSNCKPIATPVKVRSLVGSLRYLTITRPDKIFAVGLVSRIVEEPRQEHFKVAKRILMYVQGSINEGLFYSQSVYQRLVGYTNNDYGGDLDKRKSTSGYMFSIGSAAFSWSSKKQSVVALSSCEVEYIAASAGACQAIWLRNLMKELQHEQEAPIEILIDNKSTITLSKNPLAHGRSKHIETRFHFIRHQVTKKIVKMIYCKSED